MVVDPTTAEAKRVEQQKIRDEENKRFRETRLANLNKCLELFEETIDKNLPNETAFSFDFVDAGVCNYLDSPDGIYIQKLNEFADKYRELGWNVKIEKDKLEWRDYFIHPDCRSDTRNTRPSLRILRFSKSEDEKTELTSLEKNFRKLGRNINRGWAEGIVVIPVLLCLFFSFSVSIYYAPVSTIGLIVSLFLFSAGCHDVVVQNETGKRN